MTRRVEATEGGADEPVLVRPYALVRGRTRIAGSPELPVEAIVVTSEQGGLARVPLERGEILRRCSAPTSVAELSVQLQVPVGVARVLVSELAAGGLVVVHLPLVDDASDAPPLELLERCLAGIEAL